MLYLPMFIDLWPPLPSMVSLLFAMVRLFAHSAAGFYFIYFTTYFCGAGDFLALDHTRLRGDAQHA